MENNSSLNKLYVDTYDYIDSEIDISNSLGGLESDDDIDFITDIIEVYLEEVKSITKLTKKEETELFCRFLNGDIRVKNRLIEANLYLVIKTVEKMMNEGLSFLDLIEEGNFALINAIETFDINSDISFCSYAQLCIYRHICNVVDNQVKNSGSFNVSYSKVLKCKSIQKKLSKTLGYEPSVEQISKELCLSVDKIELILKWQKESINIDLYEKSELFVDDISLEEYVTTKADFSTAKNMFHLLSDTEIFVLTYYFGLNGVQNQPLEKIGSYLSIKKETVRQIKKRALLKLRREFEKRKNNILIKNLVLANQKKGKKKNYVRRFIYKGKTINDK
ncbi:MAG: sigma-70 family RNA polymerase sigma factor [Bacilli bacterium]|nr:sigma-70 family RNA polymerase sigma factor [Bacilli bacterium]